MTKGRAERIRVVAPAKVNLGLEVIGRRPDGYHEVVTLLQTISLFDLFEWTATGRAFEYRGPRGVRPEDDLVARVLALAPDRDCWTGRLDVIKHIPIAAGLGGGSTDAAIALRLAFPSASPEEQSRRAASIGVDVPFFLRRGTALATGTGTTLEWVETPRLWFVLVTPPLAIEEKTRTLYRGLDERDFTDGTAIFGVARRLTGGAGLPEELPNAFARQLLEYRPMRYAYERLERAGGKLIAVSGAGPTLYALTRGYAEAARIASRLYKDAEPEVGRIAVARSVAARDQMRSLSWLAAAMRGGALDVGDSCGQEGHECRKPS